MAEVAGIKLSDLEGPIYEALLAYEDFGLYLGLGAEKATQLELTPDKPNSARSQSTACWHGREIGKLNTIAFKPGDGTGDQSTFQLDEVSIARPYPMQARVLPRSKAGVDSEVHLTLLRQQIDNVHAEPEMYLGTLDLLGFYDDVARRGRIIEKVGELGTSRETDPALAGPTATYTVGYRQRGRERVRFGDPHAVYNSLPGYLQVCAFLAINDEVARRQPDILTIFKPRMPRQG